MLKVFRVNLVAGQHCLWCCPCLSWRVQGEQWALLSFWFLKTRWLVVWFLGERDGSGGGRLFVEHHGASGQPPEQSDVYKEDPLRLSGTCRAFTMACICHGAKGIAIVSPHRPHLTERSFYLLMRLFVFAIFLCLKCWQDCWLLNCHQIMSAAMKLTRPSRHWSLRVVCVQRKGSKNG